MPRDASGNYTLPAGNPVITDTTITADWANQTLEDIRAALQDSLSRSGDGGMLTSFRFNDGSKAAPGIAFTNEPSTGIYRAAGGVLRIAVQGSDILQFDAAMQIQAYVAGHWVPISQQGHEHTSADVTDFAVAALAACQSALDTKADSNHGHTGVYAALTGAVFTGAVAVSPGTGGGIFVVNGDSQFPQVQLQVNGVPRAKFAVNASTGAVIFQRLAANGTTVESSLELGIGASTLTGTLELTGPTEASHAVTRAYMEGQGYLTDIPADSITAAKINWAGALSETVLPVNGTIDFTEGIYFVLSSLELDAQRYAADPRSASGFTCGTVVSFGTGAQATRLTNNNIASATVSWRKLV